MATNKKNQLGFFFSPAHHMTTFGLCQGLLTDEICDEFEAKNKHILCSLLNILFL